MSELVLWVNGREARLDVGAGDMLADVLRDRLGLIGTKIGCGEAECGSCTVLIDGEAVLSCVLPVAKAAGRHIVTIEGLAGPGSGLHPLQEAFVTHGAVQCGFCTPGQIMTAAALLAGDPDPSEDEIRLALKDTLCRCGAYRQILSAVRAAGESLRTGSPVAAAEFPTRSESRVVGRALPRADAAAKVTGAAKFTDDYSFPGMLHGRALRAGLPHGRLTRLDVSRARQIPGVHAVITAGDIPGAHQHGLVVDAEARRAIAP